MAVPEPRLLKVALDAKTSCIATYKEKGIIINSLPFLGLALLKCIEIIVKKWNNLFLEYVLFHVIAVCHVYTANCLY